MRRNLVSFGGGIQSYPVILVAFLFQTGAIKTRIDGPAVEKGEHVSIPNWCD